MDNTAAQQIQQRLAELPADVRAAITAADLEDKIRAIGAQNSLHIDQIGELGDETLLAMLGFSPLESFAKRLTTALNLAPEVGEKLAADVGVEIFTPIRESMKKFGAPTTLPTPPVPPVALAKEGAPPVSPADVMLTQKTAQVAPAPKPYKADPYREAI